MGYTIGVDVGGTKVLGGVVDEFGAVLKTARRDTPREGGPALTQAIADVAKELMAEFSVDSVGVSAAGFVSSDRKTMLATPNIAGWNGVDLDYELTSLIGLPVVIENDANAAAWGEARFGAGRGKTSYADVDCRHRNRWWNRCERRSLSRRIRNCCRDWAYSRSS